MPRMHLGGVFVVFGCVFSTVSAAGGMTCGELATHYRNEDCCDDANKVLKSVQCAAPAPKLNCSMAEPQAPRDLTTNAPEGHMKPKAATLSDAQANFLPQANVHFHLGAEHKSDSYNNGTDSYYYDLYNPMGTGKVRPGFMCPISNLTAANLTPYTFQYCKGDDMKVGHSYEIHFVHSSAAYDQATISANAHLNQQDMMSDGLGGAAGGRGLRNPMVVVQAQVFQIVNGGPNITDMVHGWTVVGHNRSVMYPGSTTGQGNDNEFCSPYSVTWHVDLECHQVSPESFDNMCKTMNHTYNMAYDLSPHGSRKLVLPNWTANSTYVLPLA